MQRGTRDGAVQNRREIARDDGWDKRRVTCEALGRSQRRARSNTFSKKYKRLQAPGVRVPPPVQRWWERPNLCSHGDCLHGDERGMLVRWRHLLALMQVKGRRGAGPVTRQGRSASNHRYQRPLCSHSVLLEHCLPCTRPDVFACPFASYMLRSALQ